MPCNCSYLLFFVWLLIVKLINIFYYCDPVTGSCLISLAIFLVNREMKEFRITKSTIEQKNLQSLFKIQMLIRIFFEIFEKCRCGGTAFYLQRSGCISNEPPCLKTTGYMMTFYFYLVCFNFSISCSVFHLVYVFQFLSLFFFFDVLSQAFIKHSRKVLCTYIYIFQKTYDFFAQLKHL